MEVSETNRGEILLPPYHPVQIEICLLKESPRKREYLGNWLETFGRFSLKLPYFGARRLPPKVLKALNLQGFRANGVNYLKLSEWLAGAGGIEPPNGGIKIRCLTAWLRPNDAEKRPPP